MPFHIIRNDITKVKADIIVNTANPQPMIGSGTDSAIYKAAGAEALLAERKKIGNIKSGEAAVTPAFSLSAKHIIHTVGPAWEDGKHGECDVLRSCYEKSLALATELSAESIAFPLIATGVYGFPKDEALSIALSTISKFLLSHDMKVILVVFDRKAFELSGKLVGDIDEYIDEHRITQIREVEYYDGYENIEYIRRRAAQRLELMEQSEEADDVLDDALPAPAVMPKEMSLDQILDDAGETSSSVSFSLLMQAVWMMLPYIRKPISTEKFSPASVAKSITSPKRKRLLHLRLRCSLTFRQWRIFCHGRR